MKQETVLITGAAGFIGSHLAQKLLNLNYNVIGVDNLSSGCIENISVCLTNSNFKFIKGDIVNYDFCCKICEGVDYVCHEAAINSVPRSIKTPEIYFSNNLLGFCNMLEAVRKKKVKKFIYASSSSVYGSSKLLPKTENKTGDALSPYALSKQNNEKWAKLYSDIYNINTIGLRYFNVFGPKQKYKSEYSAVIPKFIYNILNENRVYIYGDGEQKRDFTFVDNVVAANIKAIETPMNVSGEVYNVSAAQQITVNEVLKNIETKLNKTAKIKYCEKRKGDILNSYADISKSKQDLGYTPIINFDCGIEKTIEWYKKNGVIK